jgi:hypothetical protein
MREARAGRGKKVIILSSTWNTIPGLEKGPE